ncbi:MAG TPA: hypothetical protein VNF73_16540 [Candidatus Saccharimonadales bacterium]|nr:hypothetical protein [Candidatus Saccharimonadales bacterium]
MNPRRTDCDRFRPSLVALLDRASADATPTALRRHVERCPECEAALAELTLTGFAVRRGLTASKSIEPPSDAWPRLRARVTRRGPRLSGAASSVAGLAIGAALAVAMVVPFSQPNVSDAVTQEVGLEVIVTSGAPSPPIPRSGPEERAESQWLFAKRRARRDTPPTVADSPRDQSVPYGEARSDEPAVPASNLPRVQAE